MIPNHIAAFHASPNITAVLHKFQMNTESDVFYVMSSTLSVYLTYLILTLY